MFPDARSYLQETNVMTAMVQHSRISLNSAQQTHAFMTVQMRIEFWIQEIAFVLIQALRFQVTASHGLQTVDK
mgnify:FL=1